MFFDNIKWLKALKNKVFDVVPRFDKAYLYINTQIGVYWTVYSYFYVKITILLSIHISKKINYSYFLCSLTTSLLILGLTNIASLMSSKSQEEFSRIYIPINL